MRPPRVSLAMHSRVVAAASAALVGIVLGIAGCSGGSTLGTGDGGTGEGSSGSSSSTGTSGSTGSTATDGTNGSGSNGGAASSQPPADPSSPPPSEDTPPPSTGTGGSSGPRPECVAFANHECGCSGSHASATCTTDLASDCDDVVKLCASQLDWYNCVTANACGTSACNGLGMGC